MGTLGYIQINKNSVSSRVIQNLATKPTQITKTDKSCIKWE